MYCKTDLVVCLQAQQLANLMKRFNMMAHVNLIPYNPVEGSDFVRPSRNRVARFSETLTKAGIANSIRITKGLDASAACGQLRNEHQKVPLPSFAGLAWIFERYSVVPLLQTCSIQKQEVQISLQCLSMSVDNFPVTSMQLSRCCAKICFWRALCWDLS